MSAPILIFGRHGQLARALALSLRAQGRPYRCVGSADCDLSNAPESCLARISSGSWRAVINASGYTKVDLAETESHANRTLNTDAPGLMAVACAKAGLPFIHISTDYVFDGTARLPYTPVNPTAPVNAYGRAKAAGERSVRAADGNSLTLRTSWVYDGTGTNFLTTMLRLARRGELNVVSDQLGRPTYAGHLAAACLAALDHGWDGQLTHHVQNTGPMTSWAGFARAIFQGAGLDVRVNPIPTSQYPTPAARPAYSVLDTRAFEAAFAHPLEDWRTGLDLALCEHTLRKCN